MSYIGAQPTTAAFVTDTFSANGSGTVFTLSVAPANTNSILVAVSGVLQDPSTYSVSGTTLTFSAAPPAGTGNISVRFLGIPASGVVNTAYRTVTEFTATAGQTTFSVPSYTPGFIDVYRNGVRLNSSNYTASNGTTVVLANAASAGDAVTTESFSVSSVLNAIPASTGAVTDGYIASMSASKLTGSRTIPKSTLPTGSVLQVVQTVKTDTFSTTSIYPTFVDITGLTVSITPTSATSKILVFVNLVMGTTSYNAYYRLARNGTNILLADAAGSRATTTQAMDAGDTDSSRKQTPNNTVYLDSPATTSSLTYAATISTRRAGDTVYVNRSGNDNNDPTFDPRSTSTITVMEIAA